MQVREDIFAKIARNVQDGFWATQPCRWREGEQATKDCLYFVIIGGVHLYIWDAKWNCTFQGGKFVNCFVNYVIQNDKVGPNNKDAFQVKSVLFYVRKTKTDISFDIWTLQKSSVRDAMEEYLKPER